jgi:hypothetical protein
MDADAVFDAPFGREAEVALDEAVLHFDGATHCIDHATEFDDCAVASALDDATVMGRERGADEVATQPPDPRERAVLVSTG